MIDVALLALAVLTVGPAAWLGVRAATRSGLPDDVRGDVAWWGGLGFVVTARAVWLALNRGALGYPIDVIRITQGIVVPAGVAGAVVALWWLARRRSLAVRTLAVPAVVSALLAAAGWHVGCFLQDRCGGIAAPVPLGVPLGGPAPQVPVGPLVAVVAIGLTVWVWRSAGADRDGADAALLAVGAFLVVVGLIAGLRLRVTDWPTASDLALIAEGLVLVGVGAWWRRTRGSGVSPGS